MSPKITIIVPMYRVERYLPRCLDSILNQTFTDWSAILVDDGSPDGSGKIADEYAAHDSRFVVVHKENGGLSSARNVGIDNANGEYIMFLDSDDCIHPQTMEILYNIASRKSADVIAFEYNRAEHDAPDAVNFPADKMPEYFNNKYDIDKIKYRYVKNLITKSTNHDYGINAWWVQTCMVTMRMYRTEFLRGLRFDESVRVLEDVVFWSDVLLRAPRGVITRLPLYYYTVNSTSILHSGGGQPPVDMLVAFGRIADGFRKYAKPRFARIWYKRFLWSILPRVYRAAVRTTDSKNRRAMVNAFTKLRDDGALDLAPGLHARRYRKRILDFIAANS